ncbi:putative transporter [Pseudoloma neurophilia]|uniref:Putative transporter n=1 Tax=Pseudoloma neurophilia TaxID=146866 RepID=A0A0R0LVG5_9MICR|nr:putative transporter [Pseudoloma neurophilia]
MENLSFYSRTPYNLEKAILIDIKDRISYFLHIYRLIPISIFNLFRKQNGQSKRDTLKAFTVILCFLLLRCLYTDKIYHILKVQSLIRLYVLFGVLELAEKLLETLVDDFAIAIDETVGTVKNVEDHVSLNESTVISTERFAEIMSISKEQTTGQKNDRTTDFNRKTTDFNRKTTDLNRKTPDLNHKTTDLNRKTPDFNRRDTSHLNSENRKPTDLNSENLKTQNFNLKNETAPLTKLILILFFITVTLGHTLILYFQYLVVLLSLNSSTSVLYSLIISLQFIELRGNVTKKGDKNTLFTMIDNDGLKRFNLSLYLLIGFLMRSFECSSIGWFEFLEPSLIIFSLKISIDWIKHSFFCRYNKIDPSNYTKYETGYEKRNNFVGHNILFLWLSADLMKFKMVKFLTLFFTVNFIISMIWRRIF